MCLILAAPWNALLAWAVGILFILSLALAPSTWSSSRKAFEWICLTLSCLVPANPPSYLDFARPRVEGCGSTAVGFPAPALWACDRVRRCNFSRRLCSVPRRGGPVQHR